MLLPAGLPSLLLSCLHSGAPVPGTPLFLQPLPMGRGAACGPRPSTLSAPPPLVSRRPASDDVSSMELEPSLLPPLSSIPPEFCSPTDRRHPQGDASKMPLQTSPGHPSGALDHLCHSVSVSPGVQAGTSGHARGSSVSPLLHTSLKILLPLP